MSPIYTQELLEAVDNAISFVQELPSTPGQFRRDTNGHSRRERLRHAAMDIMGKLGVDDLKVSLNVIDAFLDPLRDVTIAEGQHYVQKLCKQVRRFLDSLKEAILQNGDRTLIRLDALEMVPTSLWQLAWREFEIGSDHLKDACRELEEKHHIPHEDQSDESAEIVQIDDSKGKDPITEDLLKFIKLIRSIVRKIRVRCLQPLIEPAENQDDIWWLDNLLDTALPMFADLDNLVVLMTISRQESSFRIKQLTCILANQATRLCQLGQQFPGSHQVNDTYSKRATPDSQLMDWLDQANIQLDRLTDPLIDSFPNR